MGGEAEVGRDDGEGAFFGEKREEARGEDVDAGEGEGVRVIGRADDFGLLLATGTAANELEIGVEK